MSAQSNVLTALRGFLHGVGSNAADVADAVDNCFAHYVTFALGDADGTNANFANGQVSFMPHGDMKLIGARVYSQQAITNVAGDDIVITITTNGATVCTYNTNSAANGTANIAANSVTNLTINTVNSFANAGTLTNVAWTSLDLTNNSLRRAYVTLIFKPY